MNEFETKNNVILSPHAAIQRSFAVFDSLNLIRPSADLLFKKLMTASPAALLDLLNRIVKPENPFVEVEFLNTEVAPDAQGEKAVRLDLLVRCNSGRVVDVEIQSGYASELEQRSIFYAARLVSESLLAGQSYDSMPESIVIFIIEGDYFQDTPKALSSFEFLERTSNPPSFRPLHPNSPKIHFLELGKLASSRSQEDPILKPWVDFMLPQSVSDWQGVAGEFTMFSELKKKVETYSADNKLAMQQRAIDEAKVAHALEMGGALRRGREEGRKEGLAEGRVEGREEGREEGLAEGHKEATVSAARAMQAEGMDRSLICRILKITPEELEKILQG